MDKNFYRNVAVLVVPMALQNLINVGVTSTDVIMLGSVGEKVLSGASLGNQVYFILSLILFGLTSGASVLNAQYWGKGDVHTIEKVLAIALKVAVTIGLGFSLVTFLAPNMLMHIFTNDSLVMAEGVKYLRIVCFSYVLSSISMVYLNTMRSVERVKVATVVYLCSLIVNIIVNGLLIFGLFGLPKMGVAGAAIGTVVARAVEVFMVWVYDRRINDVFRFKFKTFFEKDRLLVRDFARYSTPVVINELFWGAGISAVSAILGHLGSSVVAANAIVQVVRQLATVVSFGVASATAIMIGKAIGENKTDVAKKYGSRFVKLSVITGFCGAVVVAVAGPIVKATMTMTPQVRGYFTFMMLVMCYYVVAQAYNTTMIVGVFRAGGDTKYGLFLDMFFMWGIAILGGFLAAFVFELDVFWVYVILLCDEVLKVPFSTMRYKSFKWLKNITR